MIPLPFLTKILKFHYFRKLYHLNTKERKTKEDKNSFEIKQHRLMDKLRNLDSIVNLSVLIEASTESSFQFWFQTVFIFPTMILSFTDSNNQINWSDLFNWRLVSILISFASFAMTFYKIRLDY